MNTFPISKSPKPPYDIAPIDDVIKSKAEDGSVIARPRFSRVRYNFTLEWDSTNSEYTSVVSFYENNRSIPFMLNFNTYGGSTVADAGISFSLVARFAEPPKYKYVGIGAWEITCSFVGV